MRTFLPAVLSFALSGSAFAQISGAFAAQGGGLPPMALTGPALHTPPGANVLGSPQFIARLGETVSGFPRSGFPARRHRENEPVAASFAYPVFVGGFDNGYAYPPDNGYAYQQTPNVTIIMPQQPPVIINQQFVPETATPVIHEYGPSGQEVPPANGGVQVYQAPSNTAAQNPPDDQALFLIALKDGSVYTAVAYWVEGGVLHYITPQGRHNQASLDLVDRQLSEKLNQGHKVQFRLPAANQ